MARRRRFLEHLIRGGALARLPEPGAYQTPEPFRPAAVRTPHVLLAAALMLLLHSFWLIWFSLASTEPAPGGRAPIPMRIVSPERHPGRVSPRNWSPVLFPLPTPVGFSDFAVSQDTGVGPVLTSPRSSLPYLERASYQAAPPPPLPEEGWAGRWTAMSEEESAVSESVMASIPWQRYHGLRVQVSGGLSREDLAEIEIPGAPLLRRREAWEAAAWLEFNRRGNVDYVFIETSSGDRELDRDVLRSLYRWQLRSDAEARRGRVHLRYFRRSGEPEKAAAEGS